MFNISVRFRALSTVRRNKDEKSWEIFDYLGSLFTDKDNEISCLEFFKPLSAMLRGVLLFCPRKLIFAEL